MKRVKVIVSATNYYLIHILPFLKSLHYMFDYSGEPNYYDKWEKDECEYKVVIITNKDNELLTEQLEYDINKIGDDYNKYKIREINIEYCPDFPWPVMTLYKPYLCTKYIETDNDFYNDDFVWCGNVNLIFEPNNLSWFNPNKINVSWHHTHPDNNNPYYIQAGFVLGSTKNMIELCNDWQRRINYYINEKHIVPEYHDETVLNILFGIQYWHEKFNPSFIFKYEMQKYETIMPGAFCEIQLTNKKDNEFKVNY